jgi:hypothetical protein
MSQPRRRPAIAAALAAAILAAGCGSSAPAATPAPRAPAPPSLDTSLVTAAGTWAVAEMGGSAAQYNNFWQLFVRPAGSTRWKLATPPGVADNGGLVLAGGGGQSLITAFRPSQDLTYTPLAVTGDGGQAWSSAGPLNAVLARLPDALAAAPHGGQLLALLSNGAAMLADPGYSSWRIIASQTSVSATPVGQRCGLQNLTAVAFTPSGVPLLAGTCRHPGIAGIFAYGNGAWRAAAPALPAAFMRLPIAVLRLAPAADGMVALLEAGTGPGASLLGAWSAGHGSWTVSAPFRLNGASLTAASFGPGGEAAVMLGEKRGETVAGHGSSWQPLPHLPAGTVTLATGPEGNLDALAVHRAAMTVWQLAPGSSTWTTTQTIDVPIEFGSSS